MEGVLIRGSPDWRATTADPSYTCMYNVHVLNVWWRECHCKEHTSGVFQLLDLSSKLESLEEDQRSSHGVRERLRKEKEVMQERLV